MQFRGRQRKIGKSVYRFGLVDELKNIELEPRVVILNELPALGFVDEFKVIGDEFHALQVKIRRVAEPRQLQNIHDALDRQPLSQILGAHRLKLRHHVDVRQSQQMDPVFLEMLRRAPA